MTSSSEAMFEFAWVMPRSMFSLTAVALSGVPSVNFRPGRSVNVTLLPFFAYFHDDASPGSTSPAVLRVVIDAYTRPSACTSQPAVDVTGSHEVGSSHSQFRVPVAPPVAAVVPPLVPPEAVPQAAASSATAIAAPAARRRRRGLLRV